MRAARLSYPEAQGRHFAALSAGLGGRRPFNWNKIVWFKSDYRHEAATNCRMVAVADAIGVSRQHLPTMRQQKRPFACWHSCYSTKFSSISEHDIRHAVAVTCLIGVTPPVHVGQVEVPDRTQRARVGEEFADRGGAADLDDKDLRSPPEDMADLFGPRDALLKKSFVEMVGLGRFVRGEIRQMHDDFRREGRHLRAGA